MTVKQIVTDLAILTTPCEDFDFNNPIMNPIELSRDLADTMIANKGVGLAANQIGLQTNVLTIMTNPVIVMFNPTIVDFSSDKNTLEEGCLSFPGLIVKVDRPSSIRVRFKQPNGEVVTQKFSGMTARAVQHEMDHLNGVLFYNRVHPYHREKAMKNWRK
jgi:peptide deformylase